MTDAPLDAILIESPGHVGQDWTEIENMGKESEGRPSAILVVCLVQISGNRADFQTSPVLAFYGSLQVLK